MMTQQPISTLRVKIASPYSSTPFEIIGQVKWNPNQSYPTINPFQTIQELRHSVFEQWKYDVPNFTTLSESNLMLIFSGRILDQNQEGLHETFAMYLNPMEKEHVVTIHAILRGGPVLSTSSAQSKTMYSNSASIFPAASPASISSMRSPLDYSSSSNFSSMRPFMVSSEAPSVAYEPSAASSSFSEIDRKMDVMNDSTSLIVLGQRPDCLVNRASALTNEFDHNNDAIKTTALSGQSTVPKGFNSGSSSDLIREFEAYLENYQKYVADYYQQYYKYQFSLVSLLQANQTISSSISTSSTSYSPVPNVPPRPENDPVANVDNPPDINAQPVPVAPPVRRLGLPVAGIISLAFKWFLVCYLFTQNSSWSHTLLLASLSMIFFLGQIGLVSWMQLQRKIWAALQSLVTASAHPASPSNEDNTSTLSIQSENPSRLKELWQSTKSFFFSFLVTLFPGSHPLDPATLAAEHLAAAEEIEAAAAMQNGALL